MEQFLDGVTQVVRFPLPLEPLRWRTEGMVSLAPFASGWTGWLPVHQTQILTVKAQVVSDSHPHPKTGDRKKAHASTIQELSKYPLRVRLGL